VKITLLGTGSPIPDPRRAGPSQLVAADGLTVLVDCGRGVLMRLSAAGVLPPFLDGLLITHLHSDHITDLGDVITTRWVMSPGPNPLRVWGPPGTQEVVDGTLASLRPDIRYRVDHHADITEGPVVQVVEVSAGEVFTVGSAIVRVGATDHRPVEPTVAFRIEIGDTSVVMGGDGVPCAGLDELCLGATAYVQTVIRDDLVKLVPMQRLQDILDYHSTVTQAADTATRAGVGTLVLTHYVPALQPGQEDEWRALAAAHFDGPIVLGDDLTSVEL
jgi:ribonuclease Z